MSMLSTYTNGAVYAVNASVKTKRLMMASIDEYQQAKEH